MKKVIIRLITFAISVITLLLITLTPILKLDTEFIKANLNEEITNIMTNEKPHLYAHEFDDSSFSYISNSHKVTLSSYSWTIESTKELTPAMTTEGLELHSSINLSTEAIPDLTNVKVLIKGEGANLEIKVNGVSLLNQEINKEMKAYYNEFTTKTTSKLEIIITSNSSYVLKEIIINEEEYTEEEAKTVFIDKLLIGAGLIETNPEDAGIDSIDLYNQYVEEELTKLKEGISFFKLFKMIKVDYEYNSSIWSQTAGNPINERLSTLWQNRHCPFIGILVFILVLSIFAGLIYITVRYILDLILKKESKFIIPIIIVLISMVLLFNIALFTSTSFFNQGHNISTSWKLLFFECCDKSIPFIIAALLILGIYVMNIYDYIADFIKTKKPNKAFIINAIIATLSIGLIITGIIIH